MIRKLEDRDLPTIAEIYAHYVDTTVITFDEVPLTVQDWRAKADAITARGLPFLVIEVEGAVNGFAYAGPYRPKPAYRHTVEDTIYLAPEMTGRGIGSRLLAALIEHCENAPVRQMVAVIADNGNPASQALHRAHGFTESGRLKEVGFKLGRWVDTVLMQRDITPR